MILVHQAPRSLLAYWRPNLGILMSPRRVYADVEGWPWAADNDAYSDWDDRRYERMLESIYGVRGCLFVTAPDVVGKGDDTLQLFRDWYPQIKECRQPIALVAQDGMRVHHIPWNQISALFIGGTNSFKMGSEAAAIARAAKHLGKWVHMGRVNSHRRVRYAKALGCDSIDGTSFTWWKDRWLDQFLGHAAGPTQQMFPTFWSPE